MDKSAALARITAFLADIGIPATPAAGEGPTFLPGIWIEGASLRYEADQLVSPGDLLHEAGHIALTDPARRPTLNHASMTAAPPDAGEELATLLWSALAARACGLPLAQLFHDQGYKGQGAWLIAEFEAGRYLGLPYLAWLGLAQADPAGGPPRIRRWLRPDPALRDRPSEVRCPPETAMTPLDLSRCDKISGIAFGYDAHVGCTAEERATAQRIDIDFDLFTNWRAAAAVDRIDAPGILDYAKVNDDLAALLASREWHLIETIAEESARAICRGYAVQAVRVRVVKGPTYLPNVKAVSAECWRSPADFAP